MRLRYRCSTELSSTSAEEKDIANRDLEVVSDGYAEAGRVRSRSEHRFF